MSSSDHTELQIGCPNCDTTISAAVPSGAWLRSSDDETRTHLRGMETHCRSCGHELEFYYY